MEILLDILLVFIILAIITFIITSIYFIKCISIEDTYTTYFIKDLDGDNLININEIEQVSQRYNMNQQCYEITYYLKFGHEVKEIFNDANACHDRFMSIYDILNL